MFILHLLILYLCLSLPLSAQVVPVAEESSYLPLDPAVRMGRLENGLTFYIRQNAVPEKRAALWLVVNAGSILESEDQQGLAHFVEHMAFNGTKRFEKNSMIDFAERAGIDFGADLNAYTSYDETVYMLTVPTDDKNILLTGLDMLEDWAGGLTFNPGEVDKERGVVIEEWRRGRGASQRIADQQREILLQGSRYAVRNTIGEKKILENAPVSTLKRFYSDWYRPDLMAVIVIGDVDSGFIEEQIRRRLSDLRPRGNTNARENYIIPFIEKTRVSILTDEEASRAQLTVTVKGPRTPVRTESEYRYFLIETLFGMMVNSRLDELRRDPESPFTLAYSGISELGRSADLFQLTAIPKPGMFEQSLEALMTEFERVRRYGFLETEFERQKTALLRIYERIYVERNKVESRSYARECVDHFLKDDTMPGIDVELELVRKHLPGINIEELNALARKWAGRKDRVILASGPARDMMPDENNLLAISEDTGKQDIEPYSEAVTASALMTDKPPAGKVVSEKKYANVDVTVWILSNGARVVFKPTDFKNDEVMMYAFSPGGLSLAPDEDYLSAASAAGIIYQAGLGKYDATQLNKILSDKVVWVRPYVNDLEEGISGNASSEDLETMMQMVYLSFTAPRLDEDVFEIWKERTETFVKNRDLNPQRVFNSELRAFSDNYHMRSMPLTTERLNDVNLQTAYKFVRDRFADAGDFTFVFVGNVNPEQLRRLSETYLASLPVLNRNETWHDVGRHKPEGTVEFKLEKGMDPKSEVRLTWHGEANWSLEAEDDLEALSEVIDMRLREVLREEMGGVYSAFSQGAFYRLPRERYTFSIGFNCAPENVDKLKRAVFDIVNSIKETGIEEDYIVKLRELRQRKLEINLKQNRYWSGQLVRHFRHGTDPDLIVDQENQAINRINSENVRNAAILYLGENRIDGLLMPEK